MTLGWREPLVLYRSMRSGARMEMKGAAHLTPGAESCNGHRSGPVIAALAELGDGELTALTDATDNVPQTAPGFLAWLERLQSDLRGRLQPHAPTACVFTQPRAIAVTPRIYR